MEYPGSRKTASDDMSVDDICSQLCIERFSGDFEVARENRQWLKSHQVTSREPPDTNRAGLSVHSVATTVNVTYSTSCAQCHDTTDRSSAAPCLAYDVRLYFASEIDAMTGVGEQAV